MFVRQALGRILHQFLLRQPKLVCGLRYVSAHDPRLVRNTSPVASLTCLAIQQLASPRDNTGEKSGLAREKLRW